MKNALVLTSGGVDSSTAWRSQSKNTAARVLSRSQSPTDKSTTRNCRQPKLSLRTMVWSSSFSIWD